VPSREVVLLHDQPAHDFLTMLCVGSKGKVHVNQDASGSQDCLSYSQLGVDHKSFLRARVPVV
jgi:hypothetical protein